MNLVKYFYFWMMTFELMHVKPLNWMMTLDPSSQSQMTETITPGGNSICWYEWIYIFLQHRPLQLRLQTTSLSLFSDHDSSIEIIQLDFRFTISNPWSLFTKQGYHIFLWFCHSFSDDDTLMLNKSGTELITQPIFSKFSLF